MQRRAFLKTSSFAALLAGTGGATTVRGEEAAPGFALASPPVLQHPTPEGMSVVWAVNGPATGWVEYGETESLGRRAMGSEQGLMPFEDGVLQVRLSGLRPGTRYFYRVCACPILFKNAYSIQRGEAVNSPIHQFTTPNPAAGSTTFAVINDTHEVRETLQGLGALLRRHPAESLIWNGDIFNDIRSEDQITEQVLAPAGQAWAAERPLLPVRGNHDVRGAKARALDRYFDLPSGLWHYTVRQGPVAFLVLDTGEDKPDDAPVYAGLNDFAAHRTAQAEWLRQAMRRKEFRSAPFRVALMHIPLLWKDYSRPGWFCGDGKAKWHDLLVQAKVHLVISGHTHEPGWFPPGQQAPYAQMVGGGPKPEAATLIRGEVQGKELTLSVLNLQGDALGCHRLKA